MVKMTLIARVTDGLPLAEGLDDGRDLPDSDMYKQQVKALFKNLSRGHNEASRMSVETGPYIFQYPFYIWFFFVDVWLTVASACFSLIIYICLYHETKRWEKESNICAIPWSENFSYIIEGRVCYLTMCDRSYPKKLAFQYLEDLKNEFERVNGPNIETAARPYAFIKFGMF